MTLIFFLKYPQPAVLWKIIFYYYYFFVCSCHADHFPCFLVHGCSSVLSRHCFFLGGGSHSLMPFFLLFCCCEEMVLLQVSKLPFF